MATKSALHTLLTRALGDPAFRKRLVADPKQTAKELDVDLTQERIKLIRDNERTIDSSASALDKKVQRHLTAGLQMEIIE